MISVILLIPLHPCQPSISAIPTLKKQMGFRIWQRLTLVKSPDFVYTSGDPLRILIVCLYVASVLPTLLMTVVDSPNYISRLTNLRELTLTNLNPGPRDDHKWNDDKKTFVWVGGVIAALRSPITHLTIEVLIHKSTDLNAVDWKAIDVVLSSRGASRSLVRVSVVFLDKLENEEWDPKSTADPTTIRRLMPMTTMMGLLTITSRGPKFHP